VSLAPGRLRAAAAAALCALLAAEPARSQPATPAAGELSDEVRAKLASLEEQAARARVQAGEWAARAREFEQARKDAPAQLRAIDREIARSARDEAKPPPEGADVSELEAALLAAEQALAVARREAAELEAESAGRTQRRRRLPELLAAARERAKAAEPPAVPGEDARLAQAYARLALARREAAQQEIVSHEHEIASYEARGALLARRADRTALRIAQQQTRVDALRGALRARQRLEAEGAEAQASALLEAVTALPPEAQGIVRELAERNAALAQIRTGSEGLVGKIDDVSRKLARAEESVLRVEADRARLASKLKAAGLTDSVGLLLRKQRAEAPDVGKYRRFIRMRGEEITATQLQQLELREQRRELADVDALVAGAMARVDPGPDRAQRAALESLLRDLLETRRNYLDALIADNETYFQRLVDFDAKQQELIAKTEDLLRFIDERVLWIPSGVALRPGQLAGAREALAWLGDARLWGQLLRALAGVLAGAPLASASLALLLALAALLRSRANARIRALGAQASSASCTRFAPTLEALAWTLLLAPWLPGTFAYLGQAVAASPQATLFARCVAGGVLAASLVWLTLELPRQVLRRDGLAVAHFGWPAAAARRLRRDLGALAVLAVPCVFVVQSLDLRGEDRWKESLGRVCFVLLLGALATLAHRWLRRPAGPLAAIADATLEGALPAWRWRVAHALAVAAPVLLGAAALAGYYWTALQLAWRQHLTLCFAFALVAAVRLFARGSLVARRRLALEQAEARRAELAAQVAARASDEGLPATIEEGALDLAAVGAQTGRLLAGGALVAMLAGLWLIWADVVPAAGILREVELWTTAGRVTVEVPGAAGEVRLETEERQLPVTLADALLAALIVAGSLVLIRNLPGALELSLFRRFGLPAGERYAYATLAKYAVGMAGIALAADAIGIGWSSVQWLVAAVGIGLGFGLQEIFANFVSGLILLFERPIRVGDTVTIGDLSGTVARIRIRATWLIGADRKDIVVPNKEFVTGRLVNWTLTDPVLRVDLAVGVAYGSDVARALALLERVARENPRVMRAPAPQASFQRFGESSLELVLRCFSPDGANEGPIRHELHLAIERLFREEGIEIAFPQRDLHLRSLPPGWSPPAGPGAR